MELASSPRLPPGDGSLRSKQQTTTNGEPSLHVRFAFLVIPLRPIGWEGEGQGEAGIFPWLHRADTCASLLAAKSSDTLRRANCRHGFARAR